MSDQLKLLPTISDRNCQDYDNISNTVTIGITGTMGVFLN